MAAPNGNQFAANGRRWRDAIDKALARRIADGRLKGLEDLADKLLDAVLGGDMSAVKELGDRLDGKPKQVTENDHYVTASVATADRPVISRDDWLKSHGVPD